MVPFSRATFLSTYIRHQQWSIPDSIIYYISKNPSTAKIYGKLIQSCKYFLIRNPPVVVKELNSKIIKKHMEVLFDGKRVPNTVPSKIWLTNKLNVSSKYHPIRKNLLSILIPKICHSNIKFLELSRLVCSINHLKFLGSKCEKILIDKTIVMNENYEIVAFEDVFQIFPYVTVFKFDFDVQSSQMVTPTTATELIKLPQFSNLQYLFLYQLPETFDIDVFYAYMKKNKKTKIDLRFCNNHSDGYRNRLLTVVDEIVAVNGHDYKVPFIYFPDLDHSAIIPLLNLYRQS